MLIFVKLVCSTLCLKLLQSLLNTYEYSKKKEKKSLCVVIQLPEPLQPPPQPPPHPLSGGAHLSGLFAIMALITPHPSHGLTSHFSLWAMNSTREGVIWDLYLYFQGLAYRKASRCSINLLNEMEPLGGPAWVRMKQLMEDRLWRVDGHTWALPSLPQTYGNDF